MHRALILAAVFLVGAIALNQWLRRKTSGGELPRAILWAWERPENLEFIDPHEVGVAYLAGTITLRGARVDAVPRLQPLKIPPSTRLIGVIRVESDTSQPPDLSPSQRDDAASAIARLTDRLELAGTQVDFDAVTSERAFYAELLRGLRRSLPSGRWLSITALASWCLDDNWIAGLPIDEAVPMLFRMGPDDAEIRRRLRRREDFTDRACRLSVGVSTDEPLPSLPYGRRAYIFHPRSWTAVSATSAIREVRSWQ